MPAKQNWIGYKFNTFEVIAEDYEKNKLQKERIQNGEIKRYNLSYLCKCNCGNVISVKSNLIARNMPLSCGCLPIESAKDLTGNVYGDWTVVGRNSDRTKLDKENHKHPRQQHYQPVAPSWWIGDKDPDIWLKDLQYRDKYKKNYAIKHGYTYLELPYTEIINGNFKSLILETTKKVK